MAKGAYIGVTNSSITNKALKIKKIYIGVGSVAKKVKKAYIGDANGKARLWWNNHPDLNIQSMTWPYNGGGNDGLGVVANDKGFLWGGGGKIYMVDPSLTNSFVSTNNDNRHSGTGDRKVGNYAVGIGRGYYTWAINSSNTVSYPTALRDTTYNGAPFQTPSYAGLAFGWYFDDDSDDIFYSDLTYYNSSLTKATTNVTVSREEVCDLDNDYGCVVSNPNNNLVFIASTWNTTGIFIMFNNSLTITSLSSVGIYSMNEHNTFIGDYSLFRGRGTSSSTIYTSNKIQKAYNSSGTLSTISFVNGGSEYAMAGNTGSYAMYAGGRVNDNNSSTNDWVYTCDLYDDSLTRIDGPNIESMNVYRSMTTDTPVGQYLVCQYADISGASGTHYQKAYYEV